MTCDKTCTSPATWDVCRCIHVCLFMFISRLKICVNVKCVVLESFKMWTKTQIQIESSLEKVSNPYTESVSFDKFSELPKSCWCFFLRKYLIFFFPHFTEFKLWNRIFSVSLSKLKCWFFNSKMFGFVVTISILCWGFWEYTKRGSLESL